MEGLTEQLVNDVGEYFKTSADYSDTVVKEAYDIIPDISYPMITISEIENEDNATYFDETERVADLGYQFAIYAEQSATKTAIQNVRSIAAELDSYLKGERYRCLQRFGTIAMTPLTSDENVMVGYLRYQCSLEIDTHTIYRRY